MFTIITCAEDELAARVAQHLFRRTLEENSTVEHVRDNVGTLRFVDLEGNPGWTLNRDLGPVLARHGRRIGVHPRGLGGNALRAYRIVRVAQILRHEALTILVLAYDRDGVAEYGLRTGVHAASPQAVNVVVAEAQPEFDAWVVCGFEPANALEHERLQEWVARLAPLGVNPLTSPERLTSTVTGDARDAKSLVQALLGLDGQAKGNEARVLECLDRPLAALRQRGAQTGLPSFLDEASCRRHDPASRPELTLQCPSVRGGQGDAGVHLAATADALSQRMKRCAPDSVPAAWSRALR